MLLPGGDSFASTVPVMVCRGTTSAGKAIVTERGHMTRSQPDTSPAYRRLGAPARVMDWSRRMQQILRLWARGRMYRRAAHLQQAADQVLGLTSC
jgi:hypothetical protein